MKKNEKNIQIQIKNAKCYIYLNECLCKEDSSNNINNNATSQQIPNKKTIEQQTALFTNDNHELSLSNSIISYFPKNDLEITNKSIFESNQYEEGVDVLNSSNKAEEINTNENINKKLNEDIKNNIIIKNINFEKQNISNCINSNKNIFAYKSYNIENIIKIKNELDSLSKYKEYCYSNIDNGKQKKFLLLNKNIKNNNNILSSSIKCRSYSQKCSYTANKKKNYINQNIIKKNYILGLSTPKNNNYNYQNTPSSNKTKSIYCNLTNDKNGVDDNPLKSNKSENSKIERKRINNYSLSTISLASLFNNKNNQTYDYVKIKNFPNVKYKGLFNFRYRNNDKSSITKFV